MAKLWAVVLMGGVAGMAMADAPDTSIRPMPRGGVVAPIAQVAAVEPAAQGVDPAPALRPRARPFAAPVADAATAPLAAVMPAASQTMAAPGIRPKPRPFVVAAAAPVALAAAPAFTGLDRSPRPRARPATQAMAEAPAVQPAPEPEAEADVAAVATASAAPRRGLFGFLVPRARPEAGAQEASAPNRIEPEAEPRVSRQGSVCGINAVKGEKLAPITSETNGCGIDQPVRVTSVGGITLSTPATINCDAAEALYTWVKKGLEPVYGKGKVVELRVAASYACRPRNNIRGNRISEHGRGNAIDIAGITLSSGKTFMVRGDYDKKMRQVHKAACGIFGTTLGPGSDGFHEDHLHFDVASYRSGPYCR